MKVLIVFCHPSKTSFNSSLFESIYKTLAENGHEVETSDLYSMGFDPVLSSEEIYDNKSPQMIKEEQRKVQDSEVIFIIFPVWWWLPPAMLKGWLERVFIKDFAFSYSKEEYRNIGTLGGRKAVIITTSFYAPDDYDQQWKRDVQKDFVSAILSLSGIENIEKYHFQYVNDYSSESTLKSYIEECYDIARNI